MLFFFLLLFQNMQQDLWNVFFFNYEHIVVTVGLLFLFRFNKTVMYKVPLDIDNQIIEFFYAATRNVLMKGWNREQIPWYWWTEVGLYYHHSMNLSWFWWSVVSECVVSSWSVCIISYVVWPVLSCSSLTRCVIVQDSGAAGEEAGERRKGRAWGPLSGKRLHRAHQ